MQRDRPIISLGLISSTASLTRIPYEALVDSGADWCLFHAEVGSLLGLDVTRGPSAMFQGVEGRECKAFLHSVDVVIGSMRFRILAGFVERFAFPFGLLGQAGFFDHFVVTLSNSPPQPYVEILPFQ